MSMVLRQMFIMHLCVGVWGWGGGWCLCVSFSAQLSMLNMEKRYRNKIVIIISLLDGEAIEITGVSLIAVGTTASVESLDFWAL